MKTIFDLTTPRAEVLQGELNEGKFAARLKSVIEDTADPIYQDVSRFFTNTYPTTGLKTLLQEVLGRLTGQMPTNNPVIRLETSFGGGKTHNLIALYHAVSGRAGTAAKGGATGQGSPFAGTDRPFGNSARPAAIPV
jgi:predicted AAA+ superfamily ATPase